ncbi:MAG: molybdopterin-dependent oxidoreductase, partial [Methylocella sp.]
GGECDLQDQAMAFGFHSSRYIENKRAVEDKYIGPLVRTSMNRCIHCTRCVRFTAEVAGTGDMGATGRGEDMEITTYLETAMRSELQGNIADLCPVGALLPKPYSFKARSWELVKTESIDVMDALGSAIRIDTRGREVMRILPRINDAVNEEWISDKAREVVDGLKTKRLDRPFVRENGKLREASWQAAFQAIAAKVKQTPPERIGAIAGDLCAVEEMFALKLLMQSLGAVSLDCRQDGAKLDPRLGRASYIFNPAVAGIDQADGLLIIGSNPRKEAPVLNARIRKRWLKGGFPVSVIGEKTDLTYEYNYLGAGPETLASIVHHYEYKYLGVEPEVHASMGDHPPAEMEKPLVLIGQGALARADGRAILALAAKAAHALGAVKEGWNGFAILHTAAARVGGLDLGFVPGRGGLDAGSMANGGALDVLFLLAADEIP